MLAFEQFRRYPAPVLIGHAVLVTWLLWRFVPDRVTRNCCLALFFIVAS